MSRDHSTTAWTPDWLGETPGPPAAGPAHAAPDESDSSDETRELIDLEAAEFGPLPFADEPIPALAAEPAPVFVDEPIPALADDRPLLFGDDPIPDQPRAKRARPVVSEGWAEERARPRADPSVGSLRSLGAVAVTGRRPTRPPSSPRKGRTASAGSARGLVALVLLALLSAFFAWVTAEPLWLAVGHAERGTVTVTTCSGDRCLGTFTSAGFARDAVPVMGDAPDPGVPTPARMTSERGARVYVEADTVSRAALGVALILLCGLGVVWGTGVRRLPERPARRTATLLGFAGPLTLLAAMLAVTY
jgi:hypothetical protein